MGINLFWENDEQTVLLLEIDGKWSWDELREKLVLIKETMAECKEEIGTIVDLRSGLHLPGSIFSRNTLTNFLEIVRLGEDGKTPTVVVGTGRMIKVAFHAVRRVDPKATEDVYFADSMEEGRKIMLERLSGEAISA